MAVAKDTPLAWLLLIHQLPARPGYQRVKLRRRLQVVGAIPVKKTVQALPASEDALEDFQWLAQELQAAGGDALVCEARFVEGLSDAQLRALFEQARDLDYRAVAGEAGTFARRLARKRPAAGTLSGARSALPRLRKRLAEIGAIDFFAANGREAAEIAVREFEERLMHIEKRGGEPKTAEPPAQVSKKLRGKVWVTRKRVHVDRMACAWLIRRFIDPKARFKFVEAAPYAAKRDELRFDMADAEFTHRGDRCSFEVLLAEIGVRDAALQILAELVHDLDLKDGKFGRAEGQGVRQLISGITLGTDDDSTRIARGAALFDDLYRSLRRKPAGAKRHS